MVIVTLPSGEVTVHESAARHTLPGATVSTQESPRVNAATNRPPPKILLGNLSGKRFVRSMLEAPFRAEA